MFSTETSEVEALCKKTEIAPNLPKQKFSENAMEMVQVPERWNISLYLTDY